MILSTKVHISILHCILNLPNFCPKCLRACQKTASAFHSSGSYFNSKQRMPVNHICQKFSGFLNTTANNQAQAYLCLGMLLHRPPHQAPGLFTYISSTVILSLHQLWLAKVTHRFYVWLIVALQGITLLKHRAPALLY